MRRAAGDRAVRLAGRGAAAARAGRRAPLAPGRATAPSSPAIRPFHAGDRLRRINWRVSLRSDELHVVTARAEQDAGVLLVVDALADHGASGGVDGSASSLDVTVRAAAALAEHHVRSGDRVACGSSGAGRELVGYGAGGGTCGGCSGTLARVRPGEPRDLARPARSSGCPAGTVVIVLSPMLDEVDRHRHRRAGASAGSRCMVVDTLPEDVARPSPTGTDPASPTWPGGCAGSTATSCSPGWPRWAARSCAWRGPGTLDDVLRRLARRAQLPQVGAR